MKKLSEVLNDVKDWGDLEAGDWIWIVITALAGLFMVGFSFVQPFQDWVVNITGPWIKSPTSITAFWLVWLALGHNTLTLTYALIEKWNWNAITVGIALLVAAIVGIWQILGVAIKYIFDNGGPYGWALLIGIVLVAIATIFWLVTRRKP